MIRLLSITEQRKVCRLEVGRRDPIIEDGLPHDDYHQSSKSAHNLAGSSRDFNWSICSVVIQGYLAVNLSSLQR